MANGLPALPDIPLAQRTPLVEALLAVLRAYQDRIRELEETVQYLRDEIAILKGQKPRPQIAPSRLEQPAPRLASSSAWLACSTIRPASITRITSAAWIVDSRCAIMKLVRSRRSARLA